MSRLAQRSLSPAAAACRRLSASEALAAGLVSRVVAPEQLMQEAGGIAAKIARCARAGAAAAGGAVGRCCWC